MFMAQFKHLSRFEKLARILIEGSIDKIFIEEPVANRIANELAKSVDRSRKPNKLAHQYIVSVDPDTYSSLNQPDVHTLNLQLEELVSQLAQEYRIELSEPPSVSIVSESDRSLGYLSIQASFGNTIDNPTQIKPKDKQQLAIEAIQMIGAFLIVNGKRHITLDKPIISIGRQMQNDIVLDEPSVSRQHAQIRWRFGRFILNDLGSSSGTFVNREQIQEVVLQAGDVILLGNAALIYGEDVFDENIQKSPRTSSNDGLTQELRIKKES